MRHSEQDYSAPACAALLEQKVRAVRDAMHELGAPVPEVHASPPRHYRQRAEFRFWRDGGVAKSRSYKRTSTGTASATATQVMLPFTFTASAPASTACSRGCRRSS